MDQEHPVNPSVFVIFGASGDLAWRKLVPALYNLYLDHWMPEKFKVFGLGLGDMDDIRFREHLRQGVDRFSRRGKAQDAEWEAFAGNLHFNEADLNDA